jgi:hypothetical protein
MKKNALKFTLCFWLLFFGLTLAHETAFAEDEDKISENPSNPLAAASNVYLRAKYIDLEDGSDRYTYSLEGATMLNPKIKLKFELHYWDTDVTGSDENDWQSLVIKPIFFVNEGQTEAFKYRVAVGLDWVHDFDNDDKGIGGGSSTIAPFVGVAMGITEQTTLIPLIQHYMSYDGNDVNQTAFRLIGMHALPQHQMWLKLDAKVPVDWQHDEEVPASAELQWGKMFTQKYGAYVDGLVGVGGYRPYDYGVGLGVRMMF